MSTLHNTISSTHLNGHDTEDIKLSFGRCLVSNNNDIPFLELFYDIFISSHPDIKKLFVDINLKKQYGLLKIGLNMALLFIDGNDIIAKGVLDKIQISHNRSHLNIKPELYQFWINSLIETIKIKDNKFSDELESKWRQGLQKTVDFIIKGY